MTGGVRTRLAAFLVLTAVGVVYISGNYLGLVDRVLGRGMTVHATLPTSGGLFEGSEVTYRGVKVGKVSRMHATREGVTLDLALTDGTELPMDSRIFVHNLSAVGEQYLDVVPDDDAPPYAGPGDTLHGDADSLPVDEADLLVELDQFVGSVDRRNLRALVRELGLMFDDTGEPLEQLLDQGTRFIDEAAAHEKQTVRLLQRGLVSLRTQRQEGESIRSFSRDLALVTDTLRTSDRDLRVVLQASPGAVREIDELLQELEPTLPILLGNAVSVNQVVVSSLAGVEQLLVTLPRTISSGFTGTPPDGYGHVNLQFDSTPPCTEGYKPKSQWRRGDQLKDAPIYPAECTSGPPYNMRGTKYAPGNERNPSPGRVYRGSHDPVTGFSDGAVDAQGDPVRFRDQGNLSILGGDAWKWLLVGPVVTR